MEKIGVLFRKNLQEQLKQRLEQRENAFLMGYSGVKSPKMSELRKELKQLGANIFITRNTLAKATLKDIKLEGLADLVEGPTAFIYSDADTVSIAKALCKFSQTNESVKLRGGFLRQKLLDAFEIKELAKLPSRTVLYGMFLSVLNAPLTNLAFVLSQKIRELLFLLKEIEKRGGNKNV
ncbi:MAG: 50S ribosomal protein L10 [Candidatus Omnitrophota bacterium]|nr:50S ribosomal protein L10 [Candidatus Omnitrophota bacterium]